MAEMKFGSAMRHCTAKVLAVKKIETGEVVDNTEYGIAKAKEGSLSPQLNVVFEPTDQDDWGSQQDWYGLSTREDSAFAELMKRLNELGLLSADLVLTPESGVDAWVGAAKAALDGITLEIAEEQIGQKQSPSWMPVRVVEQATEKTDEAAL